MIEHAAPRPDRASGGLDLLRWPIVGRFLRWRRARTFLQLSILVVAAVIVLHGLLGPQIAPANLATVVTWVHYRGLLVIALLAAGNLFCTGCPFVLVRDAARRGHQPQRRWPRWLRHKWIGIALFVGVLYTYELFDLWALPRATAWLVIAYFAAALLIDVIFTGATFCKFLCPIGQFNFVASTISPLEVRIRERDVCRTCRTADCIAGRRQPAAPHVTVQRGCELALFLPAKIGNLDCTFCLDCVQACPHDNVAIGVRTGGSELIDGRRRSGIGRLAARPDIAALAVLFTFGALLNAFAMTAPVHALQRSIGRAIGTSSEWAVLALLFGVALLLLPLALMIATAAATRLLTGRGRLRATVVHYAYALVPFGFGVWLSHYAYHLLTGALTIVPVVQSAVIDALGWRGLGEPLWRWTGLSPGTVFPLQAGFLILGALGALAVAYGISEREYPERALPATAPWAMAIALLTGIALWTLAQPMDMRGMGFLG